MLGRIRRLRERAVDEDADRQRVGIGDLGARHHGGAEDARRVARHGADLRAEVACARQRAVADDEEAGNVAERVGFGDGAGARADHDAERGTDLERFGAVIDLHVAAGSDQRRGAA